MLLLSIATQLLSILTEETVRQIYGHLIGPWWHCGRVVIVSGVLDTRMIRGLCLYFFCVCEGVCVCMGYEGLGSLFVYAWVVCVYTEAAQPSRTASGMDLLVTCLKLSTHTKDIGRLKKKKNSHKRILHTSSLLLCVRCVCVCVCVSLSVYVCMDSEK